MSYRSRMRSALTALLLLACAGPSASAGEGESADVIVIRGGTIWTLEGEPIDGGIVVVRDGKIEAVGRDVAIPDGADVIDATGKIVLPGLIDSYTRLGLVEIGAVEVTRDYDEATMPITPQMRVIDGLNPASELIPVARLNGVTSVLSVPGEGNVLSGQSAVIRLDGDTVEALVILAPAAVHMNLGQPPKGRYGPKNQSPSTRMGIAAVVREAFTKALDYRRKLKDYEERLAAYEESKAMGEEEGKESRREKKKPKPPTRDLVHESLLPVLDGDVPVIARAQRVDDILTAIRLAEEFGLRLILAKATEAYKIADTLAEKGIPVIVGPVTTQPSSMETLGAIYENAAKLHAAGVKISIQTGDAHNVRNLPYQAGLAVTYGLPHEAALRAVTIDAAEILGISDRTGSLKAGKDADIIVVSGDPFQPLTRVEHVLIRGRRIPLSSRQTELAKKYQ
ncbi:MAG: amidohydrolase [Planctomycetota bacterium]|nr:amidohydrolase [Planctomycetota bacterium]